MNKRLILKMCEIILATSITATSLVGCGASRDNLNKLSSGLTDDAGVIIIDVKYADFSVEEDKYIIKFLGHTEDGNSGSVHYINHKDYWVKYSVSREDYMKFVKSNKMTSKRFFIDNDKECEMLQNIIDTYNPLETINIEDVDRNHNY